MLRAGLLALLAAASSACGPGDRTAQQALLPYIEAVQQEDLDALFCLSAGAADAPELGATREERRAAFGEWARDRYERYLEGRDTGRVEVDGHGIVLVKLFSLGRGTFYSILGAREVAESAIEVDTRLRFGYAGLDLSRLSPGTTFYLCGAPPGRVHPVVVPARHEEVGFEVLESITVRWTMVRLDAGTGCPDRWAVVSAEPLDETLVTESIVWEF